MRHKYSISGIVLGRSPLSEAGMLVTVLTPDLGLIRARAEGVRRSGAKLAGALQTFHESELMLVRGKEGWRLTGAVLATDHFSSLSPSARRRAGRVAALLLRLVHGESVDAPLHPVFTEFTLALAELSEEDAERAEALVVLRLLGLLGIEAGEVPPVGYTEEALAYAKNHRSGLIARINRGITASNL